jgi:hypothetical protein
MKVASVNAQCARLRNVLVGYSRFLAWPHLSLPSVLRGNGNAPSYPIIVAVNRVSATLAKVVLGSERQVQHAGHAPAS